MDGTHRARYSTARPRRSAAAVVPSPWQRSNNHRAAASRTAAQARGHRTGSARHRPGRSTARHRPEATARHGSQQGHSRGHSTARAQHGTGQSPPHSTGHSTARHRPQLGTGHSRATAGATAGPGYGCRHGEAGAAAAGSRVVVLVVVCGWSLSPWRWLPQAQMRNDQTIAIIVLVPYYS
eukprot:COSAG02_NODE_749_length_17699_cov_13.252727_13_plen_180_part_00